MAIWWVLGFHMKYEFEFQIESIMCGARKV